MLRYDTASHFIGPLDLPVSGCVIEAPAAEPYIALSLALDPDCLTSLLAELPERLQQALRLLIADADAARAGYAVGYESASQFSREYGRMFGAPPARDAERLREAEPQSQIAIV